MENKIMEINIKGINSGDIDVNEFSFGDITEISD